MQTCSITWAAGALCRHFYNTYCTYVYCLDEHSFMYFKCSVKPYDYSLLMFYLNQLLPRRYRYFKSTFKDLQFKQLFQVFSVLH